MLLRVIYKREAGSPLEFIRIPDRLETLRELVDGYIETVTMDDGSWCVICDEGGLLKGKDFCCAVNGQRFYGPVIMIGVDRHDCCFTHMPLPADCWPGYDPEED